MKARKAHSLAGMRLSRKKSTGPSVQMGLLAILRRGHAERLLEYAAEITGIFEPALHGNVPDRQIVGGEHPFGLLHTNMQNIGSRIAACNYAHLPIEL